jgi:hypothetical protein
MCPMRITIQGFVKVCYISETIIATTSKELVVDNIDHVK